MTSLVPEPVRALAQTAEVMALRLGLARRVRKNSLPDLLRSLTPARPAARPVTLTSVEQSLLAAEGILERVPLLPDGCLYRALARYAVLRSAGHQARFVMGILPKSDDIKGHAWVELEGEPYGEELDPALVVTYSYPGLIGS